MTDELRSLELSTIIWGMFWFTVQYTIHSQHHPFCSKLTENCNSVRASPSDPAPSTSHPAPAWVFWRVIEVVVVTSLCQIPQDQSQIDFSPIQLFRSWDEEDYVLHFLTHSELMAVGGGLRRTLSIGWNSVNLASDWFSLSDSGPGWLIS